MTQRLLTSTWMLVILVGMFASNMPLQAQDEPESPPPATPAAAESDAPQPNEPSAESETDTPTEDPAATEEPAPTEDPAAEGAARAHFDAVFGQFKESLKQLRQLQHDFQEADAAGRAEIRRQFAEEAAKGNELLPELQEAGVNAYLAAPNEDRELTRFLVKMLQDNVKRDQYQLAVKTSQALLDNQYRSEDILEPAGVANFALHNFDAAAELLAKAEAEGASSGDVAGMTEVIEEYQEYWAKEQQLRAKEAEADDLPRVKLTTNKGEIVLELFENEAPETVGNFINLVKNGFYDGLTFHRVIPGFMAQGGCPEGDGSGGPGYTIYDECNEPGARMHFRGSLSMAKTAAPDSGGSQFFITFRPTPHLNRKHTVFGRVAEGMDVVGQLQVTETGAEEDPGTEKPTPDTIIKAEVVRDRGHEYLPNKVE